VAVGDLQGAVAVALGVLTCTTRIGSTRSTVTGTILSSTHFWLMPTFSPTIAVVAIAAVPYCC
jgi:hypothetical protein